MALFEQIGKRTYLTEAGRSLHHHCRTINHELEEVQTALDRLKGIQGGQLRIAIGPTAKGRAVPDARAEFGDSVIDRFFARHGLEPAARMVTNSNEAIKRGVLAGLGLAIVPQQSVTLELTVGRLVMLDVAALPLQRSWYLVHRRKKRFSCVAEAFKTFVLQEARHHVGDLSGAGGASGGGDFMPAAQIKLGAH